MSTWSAPALATASALPGSRVVDRTVIPRCRAFAVQWEHWVLTSVSRDSFRAGHSSCSKNRLYLEICYGIEP